MYKSTLEPVLRHRKMVEENLQRELAVLKKSLTAERLKLRMDRNRKNECIAELRQREKEGTSVSDILLYMPFIKQMSKNIERQEERVTTAEKLVQQKREDLVQAAKKKKTLEKVKEKDLRAYREAMARKEQHFLDEMGISGFNRKSHPDVGVGK
jgi:flagellar FliJ protein